MDGSVRGRRSEAPSKGLLLGGWASQATQQGQINVQLLFSKAEDFARCSTRPIPRPDDERTPALIETGRQAILPRGCVAAPKTAQLSSS